MMITSQQLNLIYENFKQASGTGQWPKLLPEYIRYLYGIDKKLFKPINLASEYNLPVKQVENILWPKRQPVFKIERRTGKDRRKK